MVSPEACLRTGSHSAAVWVWPVASHVLSSAVEVDAQSSCCDNHLIIILRICGSGKMGLFLREKWALSVTLPKSLFLRQRCEPLLSNRTRQRHSRASLRLPVFLPFRTALAFTPRCREGPKGPPRRLLKSQQMNETRAWCTFEDKFIFLLHFSLDIIYFSGLGGFLKQNKARLKAKGSMFIMHFLV